jgi:hypothetical protein
MRSTHELVEQLQVAQISDRDRATSLERELLRREGTFDRAAHPDNDDAERLLGLDRTKFA